MRSQSWEGPLPASGPTTFRLGRFIRLGAMALQRFHSGTRVGAPTWSSVCPRAATPASASRPGTACCALVRWKPGPSQRNATSLHSSATSHPAPAGASGVHWHGKRGCGAKNDARPDPVLRSSPVIPSRVKLQRDCPSGWRRRGWIRRARRPCSAGSARSVGGRAASPRGSSSLGGEGDRVPPGSRSSDGTNRDAGEPATRFEDHLGWVEK